MPYWENVTRSFRIAWDHKYLWLIALFSGEAGGTSFNYSQSTPTRGGTTTAQQISDAQASIVTWLSDHASLVILILVIWLVLVVAFFILAAVCQGATVRASAEHDADRPFNLGWAWRPGVSTMWVMVRFRLFIFLLNLPVVAIVIGLVVAIFAALVGNSTAGGFIALLGLLLLIAIPYVIYLFLLDRLGSRAIVLEQLMARAGLARGHRLLFKRLGRTLLVWLLSVGVAIVLGLLLACFLGLLLIPFVFVGIAIGASNSTAILPLVILGGLVLIAISFVIQGFLGAQSSTYWTLAFRRLDLDYAPAPAYQLQPPSGPPAPPPPPPSPPPQAPSC
jgi:hypothetical protein